MIVRYDQAVVMFWEVGEGENIEDFVWECRDDRWFGQVFNCSLRGLGSARIIRNQRHTLNSSLSRFHSPSINSLYFSGR